jgi:hypothetical protein
MRPGAWSAERGLRRCRQLPKLRGVALEVAGAFRRQTREILALIVQFVSEKFGVEQFATSKQLSETILAQTRRNYLSGFKPL